MSTRHLASILWWICAVIVIIGIRIWFHQMAWFQALPPLGGGRWGSASSWPGSASPPS